MRITLPDRSVNIWKYNDISENFRVSDQFNIFRASHNLLACQATEISDDLD